MSLNLSKAQVEAYLKSGKIPTKLDRSPRSKVQKNDWEHLDQCALIEWAHKLSGIKALKRLHAVPNGSHRFKSVGGKLKAEGVQSGVVDLFLDVARGGYYGWRGELKARYPDGTHNTPTPEQEDWIAYYKAEGFHAGWYLGWEACRDSLIEYMSQPKTIVMIADKSNSNANGKAVKSTPPSTEIPPVHDGPYKINRLKAHQENQLMILRFIHGQGKACSAVQVAEGCSIDKKFIYTTLNNMTKPVRGRPMLIDKNDDDKVYKVAYGEIAKSWWEKALDGPLFQAEK